MIDAGKRYIKRDVKGRAKGVKPLSRWVLVLLLGFCLCFFTACGDDEDAADTSDVATPPVSTAESGENGTDGESQGDSRKIPRDEDIEEVPTAATEGKNSDIGENRAIEIALARVPGASRGSITDIEREYVNGRYIYEGEIEYGGYEYEFEIDGRSGKVIKWEVDD